MYVKLKCLFTITTQGGKTIKFTAVNAVEIEKSIDKIGSTAKIKIPTSARLIYKDNTRTDSVQVAKYFNKGDKINIQLGYDDRMNEEFEGFISNLNLTTPLEIECSGYEYLLRDNIPTKTFADTNLMDLLCYITELEGNDTIILDADIPAVEMKNYVIPANLTRFAALQQIKERYGLTLYFLKNTLYAGLDFIKYQGNVKYSLGYNTPKADELKYQIADDVKLKIKATQINKDNTRFETETGDATGEQRTLFFYTAKTKEDLVKLAEAEIKKYKFDGYVGKITTLLEPFAMPGMTAEIISEKYEERAGKYEIRAVVTSFSTSGAKRSVEIGKTVSV